MILKPELVLIGEVGDKVVGFALALPDVNQALKPAGGSLFPTGLLKILYYQRLIKNVRVLALGVVEEYRASGLAAGFTPRSSGTPASWVTAIARCPGFSKTTCS